MITVTKKTFLIFFAFFTFVSFVFADTLVLKDGHVLQGTYKGGDEKSVFFETKGKLQTIPLSDITTLTFSPREKAEEKVSAGQPQAGTVTVPA
ncbi:hypothetical protein KA005_83375, partial [bacterium]|nr:hypothetical protein [bacterium]